MYSLNHDGTLFWKFQVAGPITSSPSVGPDGVVYIASFDNYLYAIENNARRPLCRTPLS